MMRWPNVLRAPLSIQRLDQETQGVGPARLGQLINARSFNDVKQFRIIGLD